MVVPGRKRVLRRLGRTSLKARVTVLTLALFVAGIWLLAFRATQEMRQGFQEEIAAQQSTMVHYIAGGIEDQISSRVNALSAVAARIRPEWLNDSPVLAEFLSQRLTILGLFKFGLFAIRTDGTAVADYPVLPGRTGMVFDQLEYFREVMATRRPAIGKPRLGQFSQQPVVVIAVPIRDAAGAVIGVLAGSNPIAGTEMFNTVHLNPDQARMDIHVFSRRDSLFVTSTDATRILQPAPSAGRNRQHDRYMAGWEGSGVAVSSRGVEELSSAAGVPGTSWFVVAVLPTEVAFSRIATAERRLYREAAGLSLVLSLLIWLFLYREMAPLSRHAAALRRMTAGEQPLQTARVEGSAEIRQLIESFNQLCVRLRQQEAVLQESEGRFRHLADSVPVLIWLAGTDKLCFYFNKRWQDFTGRSHEQEDGNGWVEGVHPDDLQSCFDTYVTSFDARQPFAMEYRLRRHDGEYRWLLDQGTPRHDATGTFIGYVGGCIDITDRKLAEDRLIEARQSAEAASRAKSAFLAMMSHELRTPMTGVIGMADFLSETPLNHDQKLYIDTMRSSARTLLTVLNDILDYSKIDADRLTLNCVAFDAVALTVETARLFWPKAEENGSTISLDTGGLPSLIVKGDPTRIKQVLGNLMSNAVKFTTSGKIAVRLGCRPSGERLGLEFEVEDTGIGISEADLGRLFLPFSQTDVGATRKFGGTGLGLAISRRLVELMGGEIGATSRLGRGSLFRFTVAVEPGTLEAAAAVEPQSAAAVRPLTILLAEDNPINRMIVKVGLEQRHHRVTVVENGVQAYEAAAGQRFDLILMDMQMPVMDGPEATRRIRTLPAPLSEVPIVALTADAVSEHRAIYMEAGLTDFLTKPIEWNEVDAVLAQLHIRPRTAPPTIADIDRLGEDEERVPLVDHRRLVEIRTIMTPPAFEDLVRELAVCGGVEVSLLKDALERRDLSLARRAAHGLKGMFLNIGGLRVSSLAKDLQASDSLEVASALVAPVVKAVDDTVAELERFSASAEGIE
ncbi:MAG: ATP-binding protein [Rhodospirillaceae bacterium]